MTSLWDLFKYLFIRVINPLQRGEITTSHIISAPDAFSSPCLNCPSQKTRKILTKVNTQPLVKRQFLIPEALCVSFNQIFAAGAEVLQYDVWILGKGNEYCDISYLLLPGVNIASKVSLNKPVVLLNQFDPYYRNGTASIHHQLLLLFLNSARWPLFPTSCIRHYLSASNLGTEALKRLCSLAFEAADESLASDLLSMAANANDPGLQESAISTAFEIGGPDISQMIAKFIQSRNDALFIDSSFRAIPTSGQMTIQEAAEAANDTVSPQWIGSPPLRQPLFADNDLQYETDFSPLLQCYEIILPTDRFGLRPPQGQYAAAAFEALVHAVPAVLEGPTGLGKSRALLLACIAYMLKCRDERGIAPRLVYTTRTVEQAGQFIKEVRDVCKAISDNTDKVLTATLKIGRRSTANEACGLPDCDNTQAKCGATLQRRSNKDAKAIIRQYLNREGILDFRALEDLLREEGLCPYEIQHDLVGKEADIVVTVYDYVRHPRYLNDLIEPAHCRDILVIDEAHNFLSELFENQTLRVLIGGESKFASCSDIHHSYNLFLLLLQLLLSPLVIKLIDLQKKRLKSARKAFHRICTRTEKLELGLVELCSISEESRAQIIESLAALRSVGNSLLEASSYEDKVKVAKSVGSCFTLEIELIELHDRLDWIRNELDEKYELLKHIKESIRSIQLERQDCFATAEECTERIEQIIAERRSAPDWDDLHETRREAKERAYDLKQERAALFADKNSAYDEIRILKADRQDTFEDMLQVNPRLKKGLTRISLLRRSANWAVKAVDYMADEEIYDALEPGEVFGSLKARAQHYKKMQQRCVARIKALRSGDFFSSILTKSKSIDEGCFELDEIRAILQDLADSEQEELLIRDFNNGNFFDGSLVSPSWGKLFALHQSLRTFYKEIGNNTESVLIEQDLQDVVKRFVKEFESSAGVTLGDSIASVEAAANQDRSESRLEFALLDMLKAILDVCEAPYAYMVRIERTACCQSCGFDISDGSDRCPQCHQPSTSTTEGKRFELGRHMHRVWLSISALDPTYPCRHIWRPFHSVITTSATISPVEDAAMVLGFDKGPRIRFESTFDSSNYGCFLVLGAHSASQRTEGSDIQDHRERIDPQGKESILETIRHVVAGLPVNIGIYFSSNAILAELYVPLVKILRASNHRKFIFPRSAATEQSVYSSLCKDCVDDCRDDWDELLMASADINEKNVTKRVLSWAASKNCGIVLMAVSGGKFAEGVDYKGDLLQAVIIVGIPYKDSVGGLIDRVRKDYYQMLTGEPNLAENIAFRHDAIRKMCQTAGRIHRDEADKGIVVICDERLAGIKGHLTGEGNREIEPLSKRATSQLWRIFQKGLQDTVQLAQPGQVYSEQIDNIRQTFSQKILNPAIAKRGDDPDKVRPDGVAVLSLAEMVQRARDVLGISEKG